MMNTVFSDNIVNLSELRKRQKHWFDIAYRNPITIPYKQENLTIMNRAEASKLFEQMQYTMLLIEYCNQIKHGEKSYFFSWTESLNDEEKEEFFNELLECVTNCSAKQDWTDFRDLLKDWEATAEAAKNEEMQKVLKRRIPTEKYVALND